MEVLTSKSFRLWGFDFLRRNGVSVRRRGRRTTSLVEPKLSNCLTCLGDLASHQLLLSRLKIDCLGIEFQLSTHPLLGEADIGDPREQQIDALQDLFEFGALLLSLFGHGVQDERRLHGRLRRSRGGNRCTNPQGGKIHRKFASIPDSRPKRRGK